MIFIIAGEASGDFLGSKIIASLKEMDPTLPIFGIGGDMMEAEGIKSLFPIQDLAVMGFLNIIIKIKKLNFLLKKTCQFILEHRPKVLVTIDSPSFCLRVCKFVKQNNLDTKIVHCVAPSVWAWREKRAEKMVGLVDHLLTLFDFEPPYFTRYGLQTTFIGHPVVELDNYKDHNFYLENDLDTSKEILLVLAGSRVQEIKTHLPIFLQSLEIIKQKFNNLQFVMPILNTHKNLVEFFLKNSDLKIKIISDPKQRWQSFLHAKIALAVNGTVALELAKSDTNIVSCYKTSFINYHIVKRLIKIPYICLPNIILHKMIVPELIQKKCNSDNIYKNICSLMNKGQNWNFKKDLQHRLQDKQILPSKKAAQIIWNHLHN
jgi:lipid-A-disaccharide synthase